MSLRTVLTVLMAAALGLPAAAQSTGLDRGLTTRLLFDLGEPFAAVGTLGAAGPRIDPRLSVAASMPDATSTTRPIDREDLEGAVASVPDFETNFA